MEKYYFYKMTTDDGGAPCCTPALLSLAICKPAIRSTARTGDWILGFAGDDISSRHGLIYIAQVSQWLSDGQYYRQAEFQSRPDCIYEWNGSGYRWRPRSRYHLNGEMIAHDLGAPDMYARANVLLSTRFRYFGRKRVEIDDGTYPALTASLRQLRQGHRVNHAEGLRQELDALRDYTLAASHESICGQPFHATPRRCQDQDDEPHHCV